MVAAVLACRSGSEATQTPLRIQTSQADALFVAKCAAIVAALGAFTLLLASYRGVPIVGIILAVLTVVYAFVMRNTVVGRQVYAVGGNVGGGTAVRGPKTKRVTFLVFVNMGSCCRRWPVCCSRRG